MPIRLRQVFKKEIKFGKGMVYSNPYYNEINKVNSRKRDNKQKKNNGRDNSSFQEEKSLDRRDPKGSWSAKGRWKGDAEGWAGRKKGRGEKERKELRYNQRGDERNGVDHGKKNIGQEGRSEAKLRKRIRGESPRGGSGESQDQRKGGRKGKRIQKKNIGNG